MIYDQKLEKTIDGDYKAVDYNYPKSLIAFGNKNENGGPSNNYSNSRVVYAEIPCCHCPLSNLCNPTDINAVINPHRCTYLA